MPVYKWNPKKLTGSFTGQVNGRDFAVKFVGYMDGTMVTAEYDSEAVTKHKGTQGETSVILSCDRGAKIVVSFVQGSPTNDELSNLVPDGLRDYMPIGVLTFDDLGGTSAIKAGEAWLMKTAKLEFTKGVSGREWTFDTGEADIHVGGAEA